MDSSLMRNLSLASAATVVFVTLSACSGADVGHLTAGKPNSDAVKAVVSPSSSPSSPASELVAATSGYSGPHFNTPAAAMRYLTAAYKHDEVTQLHAVTTPRAFSQIMAMRSEAIDLQLQSCTPSGSGRGDYVCTFRHDYPASLHKAGHGSSRILVAPALNPGWYMYTLLDCG